MKGNVRAFLASAKSRRRQYSLYYGWDGHGIRRGGILIYACWSYREAEAMLLELEKAGHGVSA